MNNQSTHIVNDCKHLDNVISNKNLMNNTINIMKGLNIIANIILSEFYMIDNLSRRHLFNSKCMSLYGSELMNINLNYKHEINNLCTNWIKCCRGVMYVPARTHKMDNNSKIDKYKKCGHCNRK